MRRIGPRFAEETKRILQIGFVHRFTSVGLAAKKIADSGDLGDVFHARAHLLHRRGVPGLGGWFTTKSKSGGGCLIDIGVHLTDLLFYLLDQPKWTSISGKANSRFGVRMEHYVYESMWAGPPQLDGTFDVEDSAFALITLENGATIDLQVAWAGNFPKASIGNSQIGLFGDRGGMTFELFGPEIQLATERNGYNADASLALAAEDQMQLQMEDFAQAVASRKPQRGRNPPMKAAACNQ